jgi:PAS domain-containing protein
VFYYWSRIKKKYEKGLVINGLISYAVLIANYFVNDGIEGPTIFFFFLTLHLLVCSTAARLHTLWLGLHVVIVTALLLLELYWPAAVVHSYATPLTRTLDIFACSVAAILLMYITLLQLRSYYKSEKRASESQQLKLNAFFDSSDKIHILLNTQRGIVYFNKAATQFIHKEYGAVIKPGSDITTYLKPAYTPRFINNFEAALNGSTVTEENMLDYNMLGRVWWQTSFLPVRGDDGNIAGVSFNAENITSRKIKEEKIHAKNQSLVAVAKKQATELREPAADVIALMALAGEDEGRLQEYLALMEEAASNLDRKIQEIVAQTNNASKEVEV